MYFTPSENPQRVLVVDDNPASARRHEQVLRKEGYDVRLTFDGQQAARAAAEWKADLILLDLSLPGLTGADVCRRLKRDTNSRHIPILLLLTRSEMERRLDTWAYGADEFLIKPFSVIELVTRCRTLLRVKSLSNEYESADSLVFLLARVLEARNQATYNHSTRVARYAEFLAEELKIPDAQVDLLQRGAILHDIGKLHVPDHILEKPGRLTAAEYELVKGHTTQGAIILDPLRSLRGVVPLVRWHHERLDGTGYPDGLFGDDVPLLVRILSIADHYDSLSSERPYRKALPHSTCLELMRKNADQGGLDPKLVADFAKIVNAPAVTILSAPLDAIEFARSQMLLEVF